MGKKGIFIVLEGLDGCGTTTQAGLLQHWFAGEGNRFGRCIPTYEPTPGPAGALARMALNRRIRLDKHTLALLFAADRTDHVYKNGGDGQEPGIYHRLAEGVHVVSDRYLLSSLAYQALDLPMDWILEINSRAVRPDVTFFIAVDPQIAQDRLNRGRAHQDLYEALDTQRRVLEKYEEAIALLRGQGQDIRRIDGDRPPEDVRDRIVKELLPFLED